HAIGVDPTVRDDRRAARADAEDIGERTARVAQVPRFLTGFRVEREDDLFVLVLHLRVKVYAAPGHDRPAMSVADPPAPGHLRWSLPRRDPLGRGAVAIRPQPLRPVVGRGQSAKQNQREYRRQARHSRLLGTRLENDTAARTAIPRRALPPAP